MTMTAAPAESPVFSLRNLTVDFRHGEGFVRALHGIDLDLARGETLGIVGESGCGKSITWLAALGLLRGGAKVGGSAKVMGQELVHASDKTLSSVRGGRVAMIFQDPSSSLNPVHRIGKQLLEALRLHRGLTGEAARAEAVRLLDRVGISNAPQRMREYAHEMSGGMNQRIMIAMALAGEPEVLIADEATTALDTTIQAQVLALLQEIQKDTGSALVIISHDLGVVAEMTDRVAVMYCGRVIETGDRDEIFDNPQHPYTRGLMAAVPDLTGPRQRLIAIPGTVPAPDRLPPGCFFSPRCERAASECRSGAISMQSIGKSATHHAACVRLEAISQGVAS
ncbi:ABC transporter ATP-binding protein [Devosia sp. MC1541]|uniref:ABC transporter ATP-binding protein n=1 Tax=Devosia sp. MC1541 TaxID=2725264 RepID=UPI0020BDB7B3|nr:ABC transporter ATP-binding protein [Devosia sp. MC1541]